MIDYLYLHDYNPATHYNLDPAVIQRDSLDESSIGDAAELVPFDRLGKTASNEGVWIQGLGSSAATSDVAAPSTDDPSDLWSIPVSKKKKRGKKLIDWETDLTDAPEPEPTLPDGSSAVSYTHLTLPTKRIV